MLNGISCGRRLGSLGGFPVICCAAIFCVTCTPVNAQENAPDPSYQVRRIVKDRLELSRRTIALKLGEPNDVPVQLHGYAVHSAFASFEYMDSAGNPLIDGPEAEVTMRDRPDDSAYVEVVPERVGKAELQLEVLFADGGVQSVTVAADITLPDEKPEKFLVNRGGDDSGTTGTVYLDLSVGSNHINLNPKAVYSESAGPVPVPEEKVQFNIISANAADPPIRMDPSTGRITALHLGHALVQSTFEDFVDLTCVDVLEDASGGEDRTNCAELVPHGITAPPSGIEIEGKKPPSKISIVPKP